MAMPVRTAKKTANSASTAAAPKADGGTPARRIGVYPGTFDPITNGHMDVIQRACKIVDHLVVGVAKNIGKGPLFSTEERVELVREEVAAISGKYGATIEVQPFDTLLMNFAVSV